MQVRYIDPLQEAFYRMREILFAPFDLGKWFVIGFTAWLALLGSSNQSSNFDVSGFNDPEMRQLWQEFQEYFQENMALVIGIIVALVVIGLVLFVLCLWLSSRGRFMFLDNLIHDRALVKQPWKEYARPANSLFLWHLSLSVITIMILLVLGVIVVLALRLVQGAGELTPIIIAVSCGAVALLLIIALMVVTFLLDEFLVIIAYRYKCSIGEALPRFLALWQEQWLAFVLFILLSAGLYMLFGIAIMILILATCCVLGIILIIPVVNAVVLLPVYVTFRLFSVNFLAQFGPEYYPLDIDNGGDPSLPPEDEPGPLGYRA